MAAPGARPEQAGLGQPRGMPGSLQLDASLPSALIKPRVEDRCAPGGHGGGRVEGPCPTALPACRCRSGCGWRGPGRRAAGTPHRWSRCSHRSRCRRPRCGQRGDPQIREEGNAHPDMGALPWGQGGRGDSSWTGDTPRSIPLLGDLSLPGRAEPKQMGQGQLCDGDWLPAGAHGAWGHPSPELCHGPDTSGLELLLPNPERSRAARQSRSGEPAGSAAAPN